VYRAPSSGNPPSFFFDTYVAIPTTSISAQCNLLPFPAKNMAAAMSAIRKINSAGDATADSATNELLVKLPGPALRELETELGMLLIG
jgi:hypothetical protein